MERIERFKILQIFGDGLEHNWFEVINLGCRFLKLHQYKFEKLFKICLAYSLVESCETEEVRQSRLKSNYVIDWKMFNYKITSKGDECLRMEQIARDGDYSYYKYYNRKAHRGNDIVDHSLDHFAPLPEMFNGVSKVGKE